MAADNIKDMTDFELINQIIKQDKQLFTELVSRYKNLIFSVIMRMVNDKEEANDLAQEVFIKVYKNLDKYSPEYKFSTWVMRIATNHVIDYRRKKKQEYIPLDEVLYESSESLDKSIPVDELSPEIVFFKKEDNKRLKEVVDDLPDMYKIPIVLFHEKGLSYQEISDVVEEPLSKIKNRIFRGRKMLKDALLGKGGGNYGLQ